MTSGPTRQALGSVSLAAPDARWPDIFAAERDRLAAVLGDAAAALQHYGSTAVPGLDAKPIIDMMAPVDSLAEADALSAPLRGAGYDLVDVGFAKRRFFRRAASGAAPGYHLHLVLCPDWPMKNELLFRDWLIAHPRDRRCYAALKAKLARRFPNDMPAYTDAKTAFICRAVDAARAERGLGPEHDWSE